MRYIIYQSLRRDALCEPSGCDDSIEIHGENGVLLRRERCDQCPLDLLDAAVGQNPVLRRAIDIDFANEAGFRLTLDEIDVEEFEAIKTLRAERNKHQAEQMKKSSGNNGK